MKRIGIKLPVVFITLSFALLVFLSPLGVQNVYSQNCTSVNPRFQGLLSTPSLSATSRFGSIPGTTGLGQCVVNSAQAGIVSFKIPTYDELKNTYFERKVSIGTTIDKQTVTGDVFDLILNSGSPPPDRLWNITGNLAIAEVANLQIANGQRAVIFVDGNLSIGEMNTSGFANNNWLNFANGDQNSGIVFIVRGNVDFGRNVNIFNGIIIAQGTICTSVDNGEICTTDSHFSSDPGNETRQLVINGNLVSLNSANPIRFMRNLILSSVHFPDGNDTHAAEVVNVQPKYLVIMKDLLADYYTIQTEDTHYAIGPGW